MWKYLAGERGLFRRAALLSLNLRLPICSNVACAEAATVINNDIEQHHIPL